MAHHARGASPVRSDMQLRLTNRISVKCDIAKKAGPLAAASRQRRVNTMKYWNRLVNEARKMNSCDAARKLEGEREKEGRKI